MAYDCNAFPLVLLQRSEETLSKYSAQARSFSLVFSAILARRRRHNGLFARRHRVVRLNCRQVSQCAEIFHGPNQNSFTSCKTDGTAKKPFLADQQTLNIYPDFHILCGTDSDVHGTENPVNYPKTQYLYSKIFRDSGDRSPPRQQLFFHFKVQISKSPG